MRVLLVSANREHLPDPIFPLGLAYKNNILYPQCYSVVRFKWLLG